MKEFKLIFLLLIFALNLSCSENTISKNQTIQTGSIIHSKTDTLKFTSGIRSIFQDRRGNYWFGSLQEGVAFYNGKSFTYLNHQDGLTDNQILNIQEDKSGLIWFTTQNGVSSFDGESIINHTPTNIQSSFNLPPLHDNMHSNAEWEKTNNDLWFAAGIKEGVYRYNGQLLTYLAYPLNILPDLPDNLFATTSISEGKDDIIWFGTYAGVLAYSGSEFTIINDKTLGYDRDIAPLHIRNILEDSKGRLWIGNNGIGVLLKQGESILNFSEEQNLIHPASKRKGDKSPPGTLEHVFIIAEDSQGNIWFGDRDSGIWKFDGKSMVNYTVKHGLTNDFALSIYEDNNGILWFGMADGKVYQFNKKSFERKF